MQRDGNGPDPVNAVLVGGRADEFRGSSSTVRGNDNVMRTSTETSAGNMIVFTLGIRFRTSRANRAIYYDRTLCKVTVGHLICAWQRPSWRQALTLKQ